MIISVSASLNWFTVGLISFMGSCIENQRIVKDRKIIFHEAEGRTSFLIQRLIIVQLDSEDL